MENSERQKSNEKGDDKEKKNRFKKCVVKRIAWVLSKLEVLWTCVRAILKRLTKTNWATIAKSLFTIFLIIMAFCFLIYEIYFRNKLVIEPFEVYGKSKQLELNGKMLALRFIDRYNYIRYKARSPSTEPSNFASGNEPATSISSSMLNPEEFVPQLGLEKLDLVVAGWNLPMDTLLESFRRIIGKPTIRVSGEVKFEKGEKVSITTRVVGYPAMTETKAAKELADIKILDDTLQTHAENILKNIDPQILAKYYYVMATAYMRIDDFKNAKDMLNEEIKINPDNPLVYNNRGVMYYAQKKPDYDSAIRDFNHALLLKPDFAIALGNIANLLFTKGDYQGSIIKYEQAIRFESNENQRIKYYKSIGLAYFRENNFNEAINTYNIIFKMRTKMEDAEIYDHRGYSYLQLGKIEEAIKDLKRALELNPNEAEDWKILGKAYLKSEQYDLAIKALQKAIKLKPDSEDSFVTLGEVYEKKNDYKQALGNYNIAVQKESYIAYYNRAFLYKKLGNLKNQNRDLKKFIELTGKVQNNEEILKKREIAQKELKKFGH